MKLAKAKNKKITNPSELLSNEVIFDMSYFNTHRVFATAIINNDFYLTPACGIDTMKIVKIENCNTNTYLLENKNKKFNSQEAIEFLSKLLNEKKLELVEFEANILKNASKQVVFRAR